MNGDQKCLHNLYFDVNRLKLPLSYAEGVLLQYRTLETVSSYWWKAQEGTQI